MASSSAWRHREVRMGDADTTNRYCPICTCAFLAGHQIAYMPAGNLTKIASANHPIFHKDCVETVAAAIDDDPRPGFEKARASLLVGIS